MANFRLYPGIWLKLIKDLEPVPGTGQGLKEGKVVQVLNTGSGSAFSPGWLTFVGIIGSYSLKNLKAQPIHNSIDSVDNN